MPNLHSKFIIKNFSFFSAQVILHSIGCIALNKMKIMFKLSLVTVATLIPLICGQHGVSHWSKDHLHQSFLDHRASAPVDYSPINIQPTSNRLINHPSLHVRQIPSSSIDTRPFLSASSPNYPIGISEAPHPDPQSAPFYRAYHSLSSPVHVGLSQLYNRPQLTLSPESFRSSLPKQSKLDAYPLHHRQAASNRLPINYSNGDQGAIHHLPMENYFARPSIPPHQSFEHTRLAARPIETDLSKNCWVMYEGHQLNCYGNSLLHQDKIAQLRQRGMLTAEHVDEQLDSCDLRSSVRWDDQQAKARRKRNLHNYSTLSNQSSVASSEPKHLKKTNLTQLLALHSHAYPEGYPATYTVHGLFADNLPLNLVSNSKHSTLSQPMPPSSSSTENIPNEESPQTEELNRCLLNSGLSLLKPYHMYNVRGQVRFIVQEEQLRLSQCQPKAICS